MNKSQRQKRKTNGKDNRHNEHEKENICKKESDGADGTKAMSAVAATDGAIIGFWGIDKNITWLEREITMIQDVISVSKFRNICYNTINEQIT